MTFAPALRGRPAGPILSPVGPEALERDLTSFGVFSGSGDAAWPNADTAVLYPVYIDVPAVVTKLWWQNGSTISTPGSVDVGIWDEAGTLLTSTGSQTPSGASLLQYVDVTDYTLARGRYYVGMTAHTANAANLTVGRYTPAAGLCEACGCFEITSAAPPLSTSANPATFAITTRAFIPSCGALIGRALAA